MSNESVEIGRLYLPIKQIADALVPQEREPFINLPGLRGYWPMSVVDYTGKAKDHSGASSDLSRVGSPTFGFDGNSYVQCGAGNDFLTGFTSQQQITGTEAWIDPAIRGLTLGCWVNVTTGPVTTEGLITRWGGATIKSYLLYFVSGGALRFGVSVDGTASTLVQSGVLTVGQWFFVAGRFIPSTEIAIFVNGVKVVNTTSVPATLFAGTSVFELGRYLSNNAFILHGKMRDAFLCQAVLADAQIENLRLSSLPG